MQANPSIFMEGHYSSVFVLMLVPVSFSNLCFPLVLTVRVSFYVYVFQLGVVFNLTIVVPVFTSVYIYIYRYLN